MSNEPAKKEQGQASKKTENESHMISVVLTAQQDPTGRYVVFGVDDNGGVVACPLETYLGVLVAYQGRYTPLGTSFNHAADRNCMECALHIMHRSDSVFSAEIQKYFQPVARPVES